MTTATAIAPVTAPAPVQTRALPQIGDRVERSFYFERKAVDEQARTVELAFSSEEPYERWWGTEILDHGKGAVNLKRLKAAAPLLVNHNRDDLVGVVESVRIDDDKVGRAVVRFGNSARAEEIFRDVVDGIRKQVSVGYSIDELVLSEKSGDTETYRVTKWTPYEITLAAIAADITVGVGRDAAPTPAAPIPAPEPAALKEQVMTTAVATPTPEEIKKREDAAGTAARDAEKNRAQTIIRIGEMLKGYGADKLVPDALSSNMTVDEFRAMVMEKLATAPLPTPTAEVGLTGKETTRYSVLRAIRAMVDKDWKGAGLEREVHQSILKRAGLDEAPNAGFYLPVEVQKRDLTAGTPSAGGYLVATDNLSGSFIDLLRNRALIAKLGAVMLTGLVGNVTIPKLAAGGTAYWLSTEGTDITESQQTFGQLAMTPRNLGAYTEVSRQLQLQSSPAADGLIMTDLAIALALAIDLASISGSGSSGQPTGIINTAGIGAVTGTSFSLAKALEFQTDIAASNALTSTCAYLTTPAVAAVLAAIVKFANTASPIWEGGILDGQVCGFKAASTNQMPTGAMIFGDFANVVVGEWGMLEIAINPFAAFKAGVSGIRAIQTVDVGIRRAGAFSYAPTVSA